MVCTVGDGADPGLEPVNEIPAEVKPAPEDIPLAEVEPTPAVLDEGAPERPDDGALEEAELVDVPPKAGTKEDDTPTEDTIEAAEEGTTEEMIVAEALDTALGALIGALEDEIGLAEDKMEATDDDIPATDDGPAFGAEDTD